MRVVLAALLLAAASASAQVVISTDRGIAAAHDGRIDLFDRSAQRVIWSASGVANPSRAVASDGQLAVLDALADEIALVDTATGDARILRTSGTPVDALFTGGQLFVLDRDASALERYDAKGERLGVPMSADPAFIRSANGMLYVYSRLEGVVQEVSPSTLRIGRTLKTASAASDFETDGRTGYLVSPREAKIRTFSLSSMKSSGDIAVGVVPVDLAITAKAGALSATRLAVADPSARRVWISEGVQSTAAAFARGFVRGLLGLGLFAPRNPDFPTGVDAIASRASTTVAFDSATGTLYRLKGSRGTAMAHDVSPHAFALTDGGVALWQNGRLQLIR